MLPSNIKELIEKLNKKEEEKQIRNYEKNMPIFILTTRFNDYYLNINKNFRIKHNINCIYGSPIEITKKISYNTKCFVLEMNNNTNKIIGIGLINNYPYYNKFKIYNNRNDRYVYKSNKRIDLSNLSKNNNFNKEFIIMIELLEQLCFYGNEHLKRGDGLKIFPIKYLYRLENHLNILKILMEEFNITTFT